MEVLKLVFSGVSAIGVLIAAGGLFYTARQIWFHAWLTAQEIFTEKTFVEARKNVFQKPNGYSGPLDDQDYIVCRRMDELCRLVPYLSSRIILKGWYDPIAKTWQKLEKAIHNERKKIGWPTKWDAYERMAKKSLKKLKRLNKK